MQTYMQTLFHLALTLMTVNTAALEEGSCLPETTCHGSSVKPAKAHSLIQSGSSITPQHVAVLIDEEDQLVQRFGSTSSDDPAFYFAVCLDILIALIIANGVKRYRNGDHLSHRVAKQHRQCAPSVVKKRMAEVPHACDVSTLHAAVREGSLDKCDALLGNLSTPSAKRLLAQQDFWGCTALHIASNGGSPLLVALLLDRGAKVDALDTWDQTPLHFAARAGSADVCKLLISRGAAVNAADSDERTSLHIAALEGKEAACNILLDHEGILQSVDDTDVPPLLSALLFQRSFRKLSGSAE